MCMPPAHAAAKQCRPTLPPHADVAPISGLQSGDDAMLAGRSMSGWTIALSLISGLTSGISYLGFPGYVLEDGIGKGSHRRAAKFCACTSPFQSTLTGLGVSAGQGVQLSTD